MATITRAKTRNFDIGKGVVVAVLLVIIAVLLLLEQSESDTVEAPQDALAMPVLSAPQVDADGAFTLSGTGEPGSTIVVRGQLIGDPPEAVVHVIDEGSGIAPAHLPRIFDRFYLTEHSKKGVGLGLFICQGLVEAMGGKIWVVSELGEGSTFSFSLPVETNPPAAVAT